MSFHVFITRDFDHMSDLATTLVIKDICQKLASKQEYVLGLATGKTPTGLYKRLARAANAGEIDSSRLVSFNLDEYIGLPGSNAQERALHKESYTFFMIQELFGLLNNKFREVNVPCATLIDQSAFQAELKSSPGDWELQGSDKGKAVVIKKNAGSKYLEWIRAEILDAYAEKIMEHGMIDLQIISVGGRGHVGFHEAGVPFEGNEMLLSKLDDNTIENAVKDGHFASIQDCPQYAISMGAALVYSARSVLLLASGVRKANVVENALLMDPDCSVPISYGHNLVARGGRLIFVIDRLAAAGMLDKADRIRRRGIQVEDCSVSPKQFPMVPL
jgi:glucosamine-6-phosphate deaminase